MSKNILLSFIIGCTAMALAIYFFQKTNHLNDRHIEIESNTIQKSIQAISKLMVVEGQYSQTYTYSEESKVFFNLIPTQKKAIVLLQAKAQIGYDLKKMVIEVDKTNKLVIIKSIPEPEINIYPDVKFYDIQTSTFTSFKTEDINKVQADAKKRIYEAIEKGDLKSQAKNKLIENLQSIMMISQALGWKLIDQTNSKIGI